MGERWAIVGREVELGRLAAILDGGEATAAVVAGEPGVGKSRLIEEALATAATRGAFVERVRATGAAASIPWGAFASLPSPATDPAAGRIGLLREAAAALVERAEGRRLVVGVDDAHLLDEASAALVHHLAATGAAFVLAGVRSREPAPDAVTALWKDGLGERLELAPLGREGTERLLEAMLGGPVDGGTRQQAWDATDGNPLYLRELVLGGLESGDIALRDGTWRRHRQAAVAPRLAELLEERLGALAPPEREALELVAVAEPIPAALIGELVGGDVLAAADRHGLLEVGAGPDAAVRLSHPLYGELLRAAAPPLATRELKRRLADAFEASGVGARGELLRVATWRVESGTPERPERLVAAARLACAAFDFALAERLAAAAVEAGGGFEAAQALAEAEIGRGSFDAAEDRLAAAAGLCATEADRVRNTMTRADNLYWHLGRADDAVAVIAASEAGLAGAEARDSMAAARATVLLFEGRTDAAVELATEVAGRAGPEADAVWQATMTAGWGHVCAGRLDDAVELIDTFAERADRPPGVPQLTPYWLRISRFTALCFAGDFEGGIAAGEATYAAALDARSESAKAMSAFALGWALRMQGDAAAAVRRLREAAAEMREVDMFRQLSSTLGELAQAEAMLGDAATAEAALAEAEAARVECFRMDEWALGLGRAWVAAARGDTAAAVRAALDCAATTGALGQRFLQALSLHEAVRLGDPALPAEAEVAGDLATLAGEVDGPLVDAFAAHASAKRDGDAAALTAVAERFAGLAAHLYAAEAAAEASLGFAAEGRTASARSSAARAASLRAHCPGVTTPALLALEAPALTRREREVATLAARGLSNREIAERLVVSVRTIENQLHSAYGKLGIEGRGELGLLLGI